MNPTVQPIRKIARIAGKPGQSAALRAALVTLEAATRAEEGCMEFSFYQALGAEDEFLLLEEFRDAAALQAHMQLPHTRAFFDAALVEGIQAFDVPALRA